MKGERHQSRRAGSAQKPDPEGAPRGPGALRIDPRGLSPSRVGLYHSGCRTRAGGRQAQPLLLWSPPSRSFRRSTHIRHSLHVCGEDPGRTRPRSPVSPRTAGGTAQGGSARTSSGRFAHCGRTLQYRPLFLNNSGPAPSSLTHLDAGWVDVGNACVPVSKKKVNHRGLSECPLAQQLLDKQVDKKWPLHRPPEALRPVEQRPSTPQTLRLSPNPWSRELVFKQVLVDGIKLLLFNCSVVSDFL